MIPMHYRGVQQRDKKINGVVDKLNFTIKQAGLDDKKQIIGKIKTDLTDGEY